MSLKEVARPRSFATDNLRSFLTILVVLHHSLLAYDKNLQQYLGEPARSVAPVIDHHDSLWVSHLVALNDTFMMPAMFYISGLFLIQSLNGVSRAAFLHKRLRRLGIPFLVMVGFLVPIALHAGSLDQGRTVSLWDDWLSGFRQLFWPVGPAWFLSTLLIFDAFASNRRIMELVSGKRFQERFADLMRRPLSAASVVIGVSFLCYLIPVMIAGPSSWSGLGPVAIQTSRVLLYAFYFLLGVAVGGLPGVGLDKDILGLRGRSAIYGWGAFAATTAACFVVAEFALDPAGVLGTIGLAGARVMFCAAAIGFLQAVFVKGGPMLDVAFEHFRSNAYGIYCVHYPIVVWLQFLLRKVEAVSGVKFLVVFVLSLGASWLLTVLLRKNAVVRTII